MKTYKVRITKLPGAPEHMAYGGQTNFGLDLGQKKVYSDMNKNPKDSISSTMSEKTDLDPDEQYTVMAENNETAIGDFDQDGELEFQKISGDFHSAPSGGTALTDKQLPSKSYIFPQTKKMYIKDPEFLKSMGVTPKKSGMSPADISKRFNVMEDKKVLDDPFADDMSKKTARLNKDGKEAKLQKLAEYVEAMKNNPQGQPNIHGSLATMAYGGYVPSYAGGGEYDPSDPGGVKKIMNMVAPDKVPYRQNNIHPWSGDKYENKGNASKYSARQWADKLRMHGYTGDYSNEDVQHFLYSQPQSQAVIDALHLEHPGTHYGDPAQGRFDFKLGYRWDDALDALGPRPQGPLMPTPRNPIGMGTPPPIYGGPNTPAIQQPPHPNDPVVDVPPAKPGQPVTPITKGNDDYLPYNGIQMAQTLNAFSRPVKGYFDHPFVPEMVTSQAMYDDPNFDPLLSANATQMESMNQYANPAAARAMASYNPQLMQGLIGENQRAKANNLGIFNQTAAQNAQTQNQNLINRAQVMKTTRDNNIKTREQMDIAKQLKFNDSMNAFGKMSADRLQMKKFNMMYPQFAVHGNLWDQIDFTHGRPWGQPSQGTNGGMDFSLKSFLSQSPATAEHYKTAATAKEKADVEKEWRRWQNDQQNRYMRSGQNLQANVNNPYFQDMND